ncbi:uncharacterized protein LOC111088096, partial [Limulus polyphemus]|uniref:Uncharacterized protein LOC111088096 n=1 Tax=Limulus polyphemus TaxID=6850 RepID=A0ABM1TA53_LIMPO
MKLKKVGFLSAARRFRTKLFLGIFSLFLVTAAGTDLQSYDGGLLWVLVHDESAAAGCTPIWKDSNYDTWVLITCSISQYGASELYLNPTDPNTPIYFMVVKLHEDTYRIIGEHRKLIQLYRKIAKMKNYSLQQLINLSESELHAELKSHGYVRPLPPEIYCNPDSAYRMIDGTCNSLQHICWGATNIGLKRLIPPDYAD